MGGRASKEWGVVGGVEDIRGVRAWRLGLGASKGEVAGAGVRAYAGTCVAACLIEGLGAVATQAGLSWGSEQVGPRARSHPVLVCNLCDT